MPSIGIEPRTLHSSGRCSISSEPNQLGQNYFQLGTAYAQQDLRTAVRKRAFDLPLIEDCILDETLQHRISCDTTEYSLPSSAYWYLMGGPGPSSKDTSIKVAGTLSFRSCVFSATPTMKRDERQRRIIREELIEMAQVSTIKQASKIFL